MDSARRTLAKALTYRLLGVVTTIAVAWVVTGRPKLAASIGLLDCTFKVFIYYVHERVWNRMEFGRTRPREYGI